MQASDIPAKSPRVFAGAAGGSYIRNVPQTTADPAAASYDIGFPPQTFTDEGAGGTPPDGRDFNGILAAISSWTRWQSAGGPVVYDGTFQTGIGGYPRGAIVQSATTVGLEWCSTTENNVTNPDTGGAGWVPLLGRRASVAEIQAGTEDFKVITPKGLKDSGADFVTSQSLIENGGFRVMSSGYKECWGFFSGPVNATQTIGLPITFTSWNNIQLSGQDGTSGDPSASENGAWIVSKTLTNFLVYSPQNTARTNWWRAIGV